MIGFAAIQEAQWWRCFPRIANGYRISVKTRWGVGGNGKLVARAVIPRFQRKAKQNRHAASFATMLNLFSPSTNCSRDVGPKSLLKNSILFLLLCSAAVHRCDKRPVFSARSAR